jgi:hypothetical protein
MMKYKAPETLDTGGGNWLRSPGTYHLVITAAEENPETKAHKIRDGFAATCQTLEGTVRDDNDVFTERDKTVTIFFRNPQLTDKNEGLFARQKQGKFFVATGLMTEDQVGQSLDIDLDDCIGRQVIATLEAEAGDNGMIFLDLHFSDIWHIDDPAAAKYPKCQKSIGLVPKAHRRDPNSFEKAEAKAKGKTKPKAKPESVDLDDL